MTATAGSVTLVKYALNYSASPNEEPEKAKPTFPPYTRPARSDETCAYFYPIILPVILSGSEESMYQTGIVDRSFAAAQDDIKKIKK